MKRCLFALLCATAPVLGAAEAAEDLRRADAAYAVGDFEAARAGYASLIDAGRGGAELRYNLGNALYRLGQIGPARLWYERALPFVPPPRGRAAQPRPHPPTNRGKRPPGGFRFDFGQCFVDGNSRFRFRLFRAFVGGTLSVRRTRLVGALGHGGFVRHCPCRLPGGGSPGRPARGCGRGPACRGPRRPQRPGTGGVFASRRTEGRPL
ncbi:MAG: tetratricopeptide repeat protein [Elusimicrobia bacterium]|nr:tetratricopeptide repeat protein [Elusimicrobiota bacterium]